MLCEISELRRLAAVLVAAAGVPALLPAAAAAPRGCTVGRSRYNGWNTVRLSNDVGVFYTGKKRNVMKSDPKTVPYFLEMEMLGPMVKLSPGQSYTFRTEWEGAKGTLADLPRGKAR